MKFIKGKNEKRNRKLFSILAFLLLISIVTIVFFGESILSSTFPNSTFEYKKNIIPMSFDSFGSCLAYVNVTIYGAFWCPHCEYQKEILGDDFNKINYVECSNEDKTQNEYCSSKGIRAYPTWEIDGELYEGVKTPEQLSKLTGCVLE